MTEPPARRIGRYEIAALLGRGGMAEVYRARDPQLGREVAVKLILPALAGEEDFGRRFASEARAVATDSTCAYALPIYGLPGKRFVVVYNGHRLLV